MVGDVDHYYGRLWGYVPGHRVWAWSRGIFDADRDHPVWSINRECGFFVEDDTAKQDHLSLNLLLEKTSS